jgi:hypothetical protein
MQILSRERTVGWENFVFANVFTFSIWTVCLVPVQYVLHPNTSDTEARIEVEYHDTVSYIVNS